MSPATVSTTSDKDVTETPSYSDEKLHLVENADQDDDVDYSDTSRWLISSPYPDHFLDLSRLSRQAALLARALTVFDKTRNDYPTAAYRQSFNWPVVIEELRRLVAAEKEPLHWKSDDYFIVAFRSLLPASTDYGDLIQLDKASHQEANHSGGLLKYWFHDPDAERNNLATCVWRSRDDARAAGRLPNHIKAAQATISLYKKWHIERLRLVLEDDLKGWSILDWEE